MGNKRIGRGATAPVTTARTTATGIGGRRRGKGSTTIKNEANSTGRRKTNKRGKGRKKNVPSTYYEGDDIDDENFGLTEESEWEENMMIGVAEEKERIKHSGRILYALTKTRKEWREFMGGINTEEIVKGTIWAEKEIEEEEKEEEEEEKQEKEEKVD